MPQSQGNRFTADPLTFVVRHQLWDGNVEDHTDQGVSIDVAADVDGKHTALSNAVFDTSLREGNPEWGVRDISDVETLAKAAGLRLVDTIEMPANNLTLVFAR